ncbi:L-threonylcarbamoyladenylate synthase [Limnoglobus roseus]|uniref:Threonylcarbamoyl-AMP synthase n=1 Tax=Limnoglobus roseus TaxID=2598579 RepID=A0A5C1A423_9BACT|nr:L-threonylcarbamoyladenylate synthase [Limnoglobus roseus]QEL13360.1 threonylcarbamoyl-AMP synthase [Limnoglobus roseus]
MTRIWSVDPLNPDPAVIADAAAVLRTGGLVAFPTETVYGLGANALDEAAVQGIFAAKGRPATNPVIVHVADPEQVSRVAADWPEVAAKLAAAFWPGPLTLVLPKRPDVPAVVTAGGPTVAVRCPNHAVARALIRAADVPVAAPSANRSTELSPTRADHVAKSLNGRIDAILDGGPCPGGIESTVVDVTAGVRILRPGLISAPMLEAVVGPLTEGASEAGIAKSPGQMAKHYSPRTPVVLTDGEPGDVSGRVYRWKLGSDPLQAAADLYATLHELDDGRFDRIVIELPPDTPEWAGVRDRLRRAAAAG